MTPLKTWRCWYSNGSAVLVDAHTEADARHDAEELAERDGYPGLSVVRVELLSEHGG